MHPDGGRFVTIHHYYDSKKELKKQSKPKHNVSNSSNSNALKYDPSEGVSLCFVRGESAQMSPS